MVDNKQIQKLNKLLQKQIVQKFGVLAVALLVVGSVAYFGTHQNGSGNAATGGTLSMSPASGTLTNGTTTTVTLYEDSGTDPVNSVQASLNYDPAKLQFVGISEGSAFPTVAATSTGVAGLIRVGRATASTSPVSGNNAIVTLTFKVLGSSGTTALTFDPAFSFIVRSTDSVNILTANTGANFNVQLPAPAISSVTPSSGPTGGGTQLSIAGSNFSIGGTVTIGGIVASSVTYLTEPTGIRILATTAAHAFGAVNVVVTNPDGQVATLQNGFTYLAPAPTISSVTPTSGPAVGGATVTISGANFLSGAAVKFGGVSATNVVVQPSGITATVPAHAAGAVDVVVTNPDGQSATKTAGYTFVAPAPTISSVTPNSGSTAGGTRVTLTGTNFVLNANVTVGGVAASSIVFVSSTSMTAVVPAHAAGAVNIAVTNPDGQTATKSGGYTYVNPAPSVSAISPLSGPVAGGASVTISGANFLSGASVLFGPTAAASVTFLSSNTLVAISPVGTVGGKEIVVTNPDGQSSGGVAPIFNYISNPGDANNDGRVNAIDLSILITHDGENYAPADFNGDGTVGSADLAILLGRWTW